MSATKMATFIHGVMRLRLLLLFSFIPTGGDAETYEVTFSCSEDIVCYHIFGVDTGGLFAAVSNGRISKSGSEEEKCSEVVQITKRNVGRSYCRKKSIGFYRQAVSQVVTVLPSKPVTLQCVFLASLEEDLHHDDLSNTVHLSWLDETRRVVRRDPQHDINIHTHGNITLTVQYKSPGLMKFHCQASLGERVEISDELLVLAPTSNKKGRGVVIEKGPESQGNNQDVIGAAVGAVGCVVLATAVAAFVINKRRTNGQLHNEPSMSTSTSCNVLHTDDVIYADIVHPQGSDRVWVPGSESTEYACVQF